MSFRQTGSMLRRVAVLAVPTMGPFEFGVLCEVFGVDRTDDGVPAIDFRVVTADPGPIPFQHGLSVTVQRGLEDAADADLVAVPSLDDLQHADERVLDVLRAAHARGAWVLASAAARSSSLPRGCSTAGRARPTGATPPGSRRSGPRRA